MLTKYSYSIQFREHRACGQSSLEARPTHHKWGEGLAVDVSGLDNQWLWRPIEEERPWQGTWEKERRWQGAWKEKVQAHRAWTLVRRGHENVHGHLAWYTQHSVSHPTGWHVDYTACQWEFDKYWFPNCMLCSSWLSKLMGIVGNELN